MTVLERAFSSLPGLRVAPHTHVLPGGPSSALVLLQLRLDFTGSLS